MQICSTFKKLALIPFIYSLIYLLLATTSAFATAVECTTIASGTYTVTTTVGFKAIPKYAKNGIYFTDCTAVSGVGASMNVQYFQSPNGNLITNGTNTVLRSTVNSVSDHLDPYLYATSNAPGILLPYQNATLTISGTTPSLTCSFQICYDDR